MNIKLKHIYLCLSYSFLALSFIALTYVLINLSQGNHFDFKSRTWKQNGMFIFSSKPAGASIYINDKLSKYRTGSTMIMRKLDIFSPGEYDIKVTKDGYISWNKKLVSEAGLVTWANYIWLIKKDIGIKELTSGQKITRVFPSHDSKKIILETINSGGSSFYVYEVDSNRQIQIIGKEKIPLGTKVNNFIWSNNDNKIIVDAMVSGTKKYFILSGKDFADVSNLTDLFNLDFSSLTWSANSEDEIFCLKNDSLHRINLSERSITAAIVDKALVFNIVPKDKNKILYIRKDPKTLETALWQTDVSGNNKLIIIEGLSPEEAYGIYAYGNLEKVALISKKSKNITVMDMNDKSKELDLSKEATFAEWSENGKRLLYGNNRSVWSYDFDKKKEYKVFEGDIISALWYPDNAHVVIQSRNDNILIEFDGANRTNLASSPISRLIFTGDHKTFYYIDDNGNLIQLDVS